MMRRRSAARLVRIALTALLAVIALAVPARAQAPPVPPAGPRAAAPDERAAARAFAVAASRYSES